MWVSPSVCSDVLRPGGAHTQHEPARLIAALSRRQVGTKPRCELAWCELSYLRRVVSRTGYDKSESGPAEPAPGPGPPSPTCHT